MIEKLLFRNFQNKNIISLATKNSLHFNYSKRNNNVLMYKNLLKDRVSLYLDLIRLKKPIGVLLVYSPAAWAIAMAASPGFFPDLVLMTKFAMGAFLLRSSACVVNDALDRNLDAQVSRTSGRPMARGLVSMREAVFLTSFMMILAFLILLTLNKTCIIEGLTCVPLMIAYPFFKRFFNLPSIMLGVTTCVGVFMGWAAVNNNIEPLITFPLFIGSSFWGVFSDTIYAFQDTHCDKKAGIKSTALFISKNRNEKLFISIFAMISLISWAIAGYNADQKMPYYASLTAIAAYYFYTIKILDTSNTQLLWKLFKSNAFVSICLLIGIISSNLMKEKEPQFFHQT